MLSRFLDFLFPPRDDEATVRTLKKDVLFALLAPILVPKTSPHTIALLPFHDPRVRALVHEAKYHGSPRAFEFLAALLAEYLRENDEALFPPVLLPLPLAEKRLRERGYNQVEEVVRRTAKEIGVPFNPSLLTRVRDTATQVSLQKHERLENMRSAFVAPQGVDPSLLYIVMDDVVTTGATMQAAIDALAYAGAKHILPVALAH